MGVIVALPPRPPPATGRAAIGDKYAQKDTHNAPQSRKDAPRKRFKGKPDAPDLPVVKFKVEPLGNKACCCRIGR